SSSKNSTIYYVQKSYRIGSKTSTKTIERLGSLEELKARAGDMDSIEWAKEYVKNLPLPKKNQRKT
ncbi:MAG: transposase, partial [Catonella sp.]